VNLNANGSTLQRSPWRSSRPVNEPRYVVPSPPTRYNPPPMLRFIAFRLLQFPLILAVIYLLTFLLA